MRTLLVVAHPRESSLTFAVARAFATAAGAQGIEFEWADLAREGFDAALGPEDEPDWANPQKRYSAAVQAEMARIERNESTVLVFPVWWWSMPALLKGWIDRVWNHGFAYGERRYPHPRVWMLGVAGGSQDVYTKRGYDIAMHTQLAVGILEYCGIEQHRLELLYGAIDGQADRVLERAAHLGGQFAEVAPRSR